MYARTVGCGFWFQPTSLRRTVDREVRAFLRFEQFDHVLDALRRGQVVDVFQAQVPGADPVDAVQVERRAAALGRLGEDQHGRLQDVGADPQCVRRVAAGVDVNVPVVVQRRPQRPNRPVGNRLQAVTLIGPNPGLERVRGVISLRLKPLGQFFGDLNRAVRAVIQVHQLASDHHQLIGQLVQGH